MSNENNKCDELRIINENGKSIFNLNLKYIIPLYQRSYAWKVEQVLQLIEDINKIEYNTKYYIGTLITHKKDKEFEIIDGQQRLTTIFLLLNCLKIETENTLIFACRDKSNYTLKNIKKIIDDKKDELEAERLENNIVKNANFIQQYIEKNLKYNINDFINKLKRVIIYRIEVPEKTDLNHYFEIMNTRGEQLEQQDILKANLMSYLKEKDKDIFSTIWDACSNMDVYLQMNFKVKDRSLIFNNEWNEIPSSEWEYYKELENNKSDNYKINTEEMNIEEIIKSDIKDEIVNLSEDGEQYVKFKSIIDFPYFLLHTLKIFIRLKCIENSEENKKIIDDILDDEKLVDSFNKVIEKGRIKNKKINTENFVKEFIICLLRNRFLFDKYIIKRKILNNSNDDQDGEWSLQELHVSGQQSKKKPYYKNTCFTEEGKWEKTNNQIVKENIILKKNKNNME